MKRLTFFLLPLFWIGCSNQPVSSSLSGIGTSDSLPIKNIESIYEAQKEAACDRATESEVGSDPDPTVDLVKISGAVVNIDQTEYPLIRTVQVSVLGHEKDLFTFVRPDGSFSLEIPPDIDPVLVTEGSALESSPWIKTIHARYSDAGACNLVLFAIPSPVFSGSLAASIDHYLEHQDEENGDLFRARSIASSQGAILAMVLESYQTSTEPGSGIRGVPGVSIFASEEDLPALAYMNQTCAQSGCREERESSSFLFHPGGYPFTDTSGTAATFGDADRGASSVTLSFIDFRDYGALFTQLEAPVEPGALTLAITGCLDQACTYNFGNLVNAGVCQKEL